MIELIEWIDPYSDDSAWTDLDSVEVDLPTVYTIGHVIKETDDVVVLAHSIGKKPNQDTDEVCGIMVLPKVVIKERRQLDVIVRETGQG